MGTILFSQTAQAFFDVDLGYSEIPSDAVEVSDGDYRWLLEKRAEGFFLFSDLTFSADARKSACEVFSVGLGRWIDPRTPEQVRQDYYDSLRPLSRFQLRKALARAGVKVADVRELIGGAVQDDQEREEALIEWDDAPSFDRFGSVVVLIAGALGLGERDVNEIWEVGLKF